MATKAPVHATIWYFSRARGKWVALQAFALTADDEFLAECQIPSIENCAGALRQSEAYNADVVALTVRYYSATPADGIGDSP